jgi:hypothetical protein
MGVVQTHLCTSRFYNSERYKLNWDALGAIAELLGAVAVIVSILYLAAQVKQSAADVRSNIIHSLHSNEVELQAKPATDLILARAVEKAFTGAKLDDDERAQFSMWFYSNMINFEQVYIEYKRLGVESDLFEAQCVRISGGLEPAISKAVWNRLRNRFSEEFQNYVQKDCLNFSTK